MLDACVAVLVEIVAERLTVVSSFFTLADVSETSMVGIDDAPFAVLSVTVSIESVTERLLTVV
jgi:hypothetical protein